MTITVPKDLGNRLTRSTRAPILRTCSRASFIRRDGEPLDDLLPGLWIDTKAAETTFEASDIAKAA